MKNNGVFTVLSNEEKDYVIVYVEKGVMRKLTKYTYPGYAEATNYLDGHKDELDKYVTELKNKEQAEREEQERIRLKKEEEEKRIAEEATKKKAARKEKTKRGIASLLIAATLLTGGHFVGKGISATIKERNSNKETHSNQGTTMPTDSTKNNAIDNITTKDDIYSTENFETLVATFAKPYMDNELGLSTEDLIKFVAITNIDALVEENPEFAKELFSVQTAEEFLNDAAKTIGVTYMYNHNKWEEEGKTDNFIWISNAIPDGNPQKEKMQEIESYVKRIAEASKKEDAEEVNKIAIEFIEALVSPDGSLNALDDGVEFASQVYIALINNSLGRNYLTQENRDYFNTRSSSEQNVSNIFAVYERCITDTKVKTKTK